MTSSIRVMVRPRRSLLTAAFFSILAAMIPVFGVLYWFAIREGDMTDIAIVMVANALVIAASAAAMLRQLSVYTAVTDTEVRGRGIFSPMVHVPIETIGSVHLVETYVGQSTEPTTQLLICDGDGVCVFRNRGSFWHEGDLEAVAAAIPAPLEVVTQPVSMREFFRAYPTSAYWFERNPLLRVLVTIAASLAALGATFWLVSVVTA